MASSPTPESHLISASHEKEHSTIELPSILSVGDQTLIHNSEYYFDDELSIFSVEDQLFKVHRYFLSRESQVFHWMFACPPRGDGQEGDSDDKPIRLPNVTPKEFESLLDFFYKNPERDVPLQQWIDLLSISTRFDFERARLRAIAEIAHSSLDPIEKIVLAGRYDVPEWLAGAYAALCQRAHPLEELEAEKLGYKTTVLLWRAREAIREQSRSRSRSISPGPVPGWGSIHVPAISPPSSPPPGLYQPHSPRLVARVVNEVFFPVLVDDPLA